MDNQVGGDAMECVVDHTNKDIVYAFNQKGSNLFVTQDGGANWSRTAAAPPPPVQGEWIVPLIMNPTDHTILYAGYNLVCKIDNLGAGSPRFTPVSPLFDAPLR